VSGSHVRSSVSIGSRVQVRQRRKRGGILDSSSGADGAGAKCGVGERFPKQIHHWWSSDQDLIAVDEHSRAAASSSDPSRPSGWPTNSSTRSASAAWIRGTNRGFTYGSSRRP